jgi:Zn-dependent metalloprotease
MKHIRLLTCMLRLSLSTALAVLLATGYAGAAPPSADPPTPALTVPDRIERLTGSAIERKKPPVKAKRLTPQVYAPTDTTAVDTPVKGLNRDGTLRSLVLPPGRHIQVSGAPAGNHDRIAHEFIRQNAALLGTESSDVSFVQYKKRSHLRGSTVKFEQHYKGVPFFAAEVLVQVNDEDGVDYLASGLSRSGKQAEVGALSLTPSITPEAAILLAKADLRKRNSSAAVTTDKLRLEIFDPAVLDISGPVRLSWHFTATSKDDHLLDTEFVIDAHNGEIIRDYPVHKPALSRKIYDGANSSASAATLARDEGGAASTEAQVNDAYDLLKLTYDYYSNLIGRDGKGRDGIDNLGSTISAEVRACRTTETCPMNNSYGGTLYMLFGDGWAKDDVVGHEYTHGVTANECNLKYENASGAINEALSDIFGEFIDWSNNPAGTDPDRWRIGEDVATWTGNYRRSMSDPPLFLDPDSISSTYYVQPVTTPSNANDRGGVHTNSGIINKLAYLLTDGDSFNGWWVYGMGETNVAALFYDASVNTMTTTSGYADLCSALLAAASYYGWWQEDRNNIFRACNAVGILNDSIIHVSSACTPPFMFGTSSYPFCAPSTGISFTPVGGMLKIWPGTYSEVLDIDKAMIIENWNPGNGDVILGP